MKSRSRQWAGVGLLGLVISLGASAEDPNGGSVGRSPLTSRDEVRQTQPPREGYYQDIPRRYGDNRYWPGGGPGQRPDGNRYDVMAYPLYGQGREQQHQDRYQCHRWAAGQSGFDPASARHAPPAHVSEGYRRALGACFSGRGYSIN
ncbi:hypothetical protein D3C76_476070 [compost metagenome]